MSLDIVPAMLDPELIGEVVSIQIIKLVGPDKLEIDPTEIVKIVGRLQWYGTTLGSVTFKIEGADRHDKIFLDEHVVEVYHHIKKD